MCVFQICKNPQRSDDQIHTVLPFKSPKTHIAGEKQLHATCKANFVPLSTPKASVAWTQSSSPEIHLKASSFEHIATCIASNASLGSSRSWPAKISLYAVSTPGHLCKHSGLGRCKRRMWTPKSAWEITTKSWPTIQGRSIFHNVPNFQTQPDWCIIHMSQGLNSLYWGWETSHL